MFATKKIFQKIMLRKLSFVFLNLLKIRRLQFLIFLLKKGLYCFLVTDNVTADFILQEFTSISANSIKVCEIYNSWKQSLIEDLLNKNKVKFTCLNQKNLFKSFKKALVADIGRKGFLEYIEENKSQQGDFLQYTRFATNI